MFAAASRTAGHVDGPVLVTGGAGYIGSHAVRLMEAMGVDVVVVDDLSAGHRDAVRAPLEVVDVRDARGLGDVFARHRPRSVMHFAGRISVPESVTDPALYYHGNVGATLALLDTMRQHGCNEIVFSSTCATYGVPATPSIDEATPQAPISPYGRSKLHVEHVLEDYAHAYGVRFAALRYFNAAGAAPEDGLGERHDPETHLIPRVLDVALGRAPAVHVYGTDYDTPDGSCVRDYIHVVDLARAHTLALERLQQGTGRVLCNLGTGQGYSVLEVVEAARRVTGHAIPVEISPRRDGDVPTLVANAALSRRLLGWEPSCSDLEAIVADAWRFVEPGAATETHT